jgi:endonuclease/exonuclease/phosphatase family metal-dependent hydrolase
MSSRQFWFVVLHLKSDGMGAHGSLEARRVEEAKVALHKIESLTPKRPVVVVGDLNSDRFLYKTFEQKKIRHVMNVFEDFDCVLPLQPTYRHWTRAAFDHILVRGATVAKTFVPVSNEVAPNSRQGSDHFPVYADLVIE